ncbi:MAG: hypothetical protein GWM88_05165 [Pseudomonadales bacterium]|nr:hypothetical protein [Pseudomonadales bacterium]NIX07430.1 hypothetical protein [Pseudomonadales bacterium]
MRIEPLKGWHRYTELMNAEPDPRRKAMLDNMRHHLKYECLGDPAIFDSMVPDPEYRFYSSFDNAVLTGMAEVREFYYNIWNTRSSLVELAIHRCATADWGVACEGEWYQQVPGETLIANGQEADDPDAWYLSHAHLSWFFPFREVDGRMLLEGEICYIDEPGSTLQKLDTADVITLEGAKASWAALQ